MADVFISYAGEDREQARLVAARLEADGFSVWWDTKLLSGEQYRKTIMTELARARAVIVLWTKSSINSAWVASEAGRGHAVGMLIPVKASEVDYADIPPPFDTLHTEPLGRLDNIAAAVAAQLARPKQSIGFGYASRQLRYQLLAWLGAAGGALTLFTNIGSLLKLSEWARWVVERWLDWTSAFWGWISSLINIDLPAAFQIDMTFMIFVLLAAMASHFTYVLATGDRSLPFLKLRFLIGWHALAAAAWLQICALGTPYVADYMYRSGYSLVAYQMIQTMYGFVSVFGFVYLLGLRWPRAPAINTAFAIATIATLFFEAAAYRALDDLDRPGSAAVENIPVILMSFACLLVASPHFFHKRLWLLLALLVLLVIGNEIAKLGLQL